ncbi:hypothetical protein JIW86_03065 [Streptomyces sp. NBC_00162]|nr:hypothetical protein [Streptomyces sp. NBC_00162]UUU44933.1 hypothetical protein JIW86_03065 [Streptomyces sp. NBC_00162]
MDRRSGRRDRWDVSAVPSVVADAAGEDLTERILFQLQQALHRARPNTGILS